MIKSRSTTTNIPSSFYGPLSSEIPESSENPQSCTPVPPFDTPSSSVVAQFSYLVDKVNILIESFDIMVHDIQRLTNNFAHNLSK